MAAVTRLWPDLGHAGARAVLLYRFHIAVIAVNLLAVVIDVGAGRTFNAGIEAAAAALLFFNTVRLRRGADTAGVALVFLAVIAAALYTQIWIGHFATMSVVFVLLLPLATLPFLRLRHSLMIELLMVGVMVLLLYMEHRVNPGNPIFRNPQALFHLGYAALIIFLFGLLYHLSIVHTFDELDDSNRQKEMLLKEVHHRVKNNLNVIASIVGLQAGGTEGPEREHLEKTRIRIESIAMVHEMLYKSDDLAGVDFETYMKRLSDILLKMYDKLGRITVRIEAAGAVLPLESMIQLGIMVNEMLTNSIKYAYDGEESGTVEMRLSEEGDGWHFVYQDDGRGVADTASLRRGRSLGTKLIMLTARQLRGDVSVSSPKGLRYDIRFERT